MAITCDPAKRDWTLANRGLDFRDAEQVLNGTVLEFPDDRFDYGEDRIVTVGLLGHRIVVVGWVDRAEGPHVFSMRLATKGEQHDYYRSVA